MLERLRWWRKAPDKATRFGPSEGQLQALYKGLAKDLLGAKPLVLYEDDEVVALASEEIAIRQVLDREIETHDPYEGEVKVWSR